MSAQIYQLNHRNIPAKAHNVIHARRYGDIVADLASQIVEEYDNVHSENGTINVENCHMREIIVDKLSVKYNLTRELVLQDIEQFIIDNYDELHSSPEPIGIAAHN